jgi:hypothetical protein
MRTTVRLNDNILRTAKKVAVERHTTLTALIDAGLRYILSLSSETSSPKKNIKLKTVKGSGLKAGVNFDSNSSLLEKMEQ